MPIMYKDMTWEQKDRFRSFLARQFRDFAGHPVESYDIDKPRDLFDQSPFKAISARAKEFGFRGGMDALWDDRCPVNVYQNNSHGDHIEVYITRSRKDLYKRDGWSGKGEIAFITIDFLPEKSEAFMPDLYAHRLEAEF